MGLDVRLAYCHDTTISSWTMCECEANRENGTLSYVLLSLLRQAGESPKDWSVDRINI
jgi:hypothetical protein